MSQFYHKLPSEILGIEDEYTGYCLNEACADIQARINNGDTPQFRKKYQSFTALYDSYK